MHIPFGAPLIHSVRQFFIDLEVNVPETSEVKVVRLDSGGVLSLEKSLSEQNIQENTALDLKVQMTRSAQYDNLQQKSEVLAELTAGAFRAKRWLLGGIFVLGT